MKLNEQQVMELVSILLDGLVYDGAHHKQKYLEEALKLVTSEGDFEGFKERYDWEEGC